MRAEDAPPVPTGWRRSASGGLHRNRGDWWQTVAASDRGYHVTMGLTKPERTLEDALAIADEVLG